MSMIEASNINDLSREVARTEAALERAEKRLRDLSEDVMRAANEVQMAINANTEATFKYRAAALALRENAQ